MSGIPDRWRNTRWLIVLAVVATCAAANTEENLPRLTGKVLRVVDGDTIRMQLDSGMIDVRFDGIDAPERDQSFGTEATRLVEELLAGKAVSLQVVSQDRYERLVAVVFADEMDVNAELVRRGYAWAYRRFLREPTYCYLEDGARRLRRGLWQLPADQRVAPWEWRAFKRGQLHAFSDYSSETARRCATAVATSETRS